MLAAGGLARIADVPLSAGRCNSTALNLFLARASKQNSDPAARWQASCLTQNPSDSRSTGLHWGRDMKFATGLLAAVLLLAGVGASHAVVRIADDRGGRIGSYIDKYQRLRTSGETVIIDGLCASACTIVLGAVPHNRICVTSHANLGFHAAWDFGASGRSVTNPDATQMLFSMYPSPVRRWIAARGGLKPQMIFLRGKQLMSMYRPCYLDAQASSSR
jgi:hypothetical protein